jgi:hypothetical protein
LTACGAKLRRYIPASLRTDGRVVEGARLESV